MHDQDDTTDHGTDFTPEIQIHAFDRETGQAITINPLSWTHGVSSSLSMTDRVQGADPVDQTLHQSFSFVKYLDQHSPDLYRHCADGTVFERVVFRRFWPDPLFVPSKLKDPQRNEYRVELEGASLDFGSTSGADTGLPTESWALDFCRITWIYITQNAYGRPQTTHRASAVADAEAFSQFEHRAAPS